MNRKIILLSIESNTGTDRVVSDLHFRLLQSGFDVELAKPMENFNKFFLTPFSILSKFPGKRVLANILFEIQILIRLCKTPNENLTLVSFVYPLWTPIIGLLKLTGRIEYYFQLPDFMWKKKYISNFRWKIHSLLVWVGIKYADKILVPSASAHLDCLTYVKESYHNKIVKLTTPINPMYWDALESKEIESLISKKFIFHPAGLKKSKNTINAISAFNLIEMEDLYFVLIVNASNTETSDELSQLTSNNRVVALRNLDDSNMKWLYENSLFVSVVSVEEGLGMPILEALHFRKKMVISNTSALPEAASFRGFYVDPFEVSSIKRGYLKAIDGTNLLISKPEAEIYGQNCLEEIKEIFGK